MRKRNNTRFLAIIVSIGMTFSNVFAAESFFIDTDEAVYQKADLFDSENYEENEQMATPDSELSNDFDFFMETEEESENETPDGLNRLDNKPLDVEVNFDNEISGSVGELENEMPEVIEESENEVSDSTEGAENQSGDKVTEILFSDFDTNQEEFQEVGETDIQTTLSPEQLCKIQWFWSMNEEISERSYREEEFPHQANSEKEEEPLEAVPEDLQQEMDAASVLNNEKGEEISKSYSAVIHGKKVEIVFDEQSCRWIMPFQVDNNGFGLDEIRSYFPDKVLIHKTKLLPVQEPLEDEDTEVDLVYSWNCVTYIEQEDGSWPLEGEYCFTGHTSEDLEVNIYLVLFKEEPIMLAEIDFDGDKETGTLGTCGENLSWVVENGILTVTGTGDMEDYETGKAPWYSMKDSIISLTLTEGLTSIGNAAFYELGRITSVYIPDSVKKIGQNAFAECGSLVNVRLPDGIAVIEYRTFYNCSSLSNMNSGEELEPVIPDHEHVTKKVVGKEATCTNEGLTDGEKCAVCGEMIVPQIVIPAKGHQTVITNGKAATCTEPGLTEGKKCTVCGKVLEEQQEIPALGHTPEIIPSNEATCLKTGLTEGEKCSVCGEILTSQEIIEKLKPKMTLNVSGTILLKEGQTSKAVKITNLAAGDSVKSVKSSNTKVLKVSYKNGTITLKALNKTGTSTVTVFLESGLKKAFKVKIQKTEVRTTKISGLKKKITVKKGKTVTLKPVLIPITSTQKIIYSSSNKKVATVSSKGVIKGLKSGTAKITVKSGTKKFVIRVTVK